MKVFKLPSFNIKQRVVLLITEILFFIPLMTGCSWLGVNDLIDLLLYPASLIYAFSPFILIGSLVMIGPMIILAIPPILKGRQMQLHNQLIMVKIMIGGFIISFLMAIAFDFFYLNQLEQRGYTACRGTPIAYRPGKATQYVLDPDLCEGKKRKAAKAGRR